MECYIWAVLPQPKVRFHEAARGLNHLGRDFLLWYVWQLFYKFRLLSNKSRLLSYKSRLLSFKSRLLFYKSRLLFHKSRLKFYKSRLKLYKSELLYSTNPSYYPTSSLIEFPLPSCMGYYIWGVLHPRSDSMRQQGGWTIWAGTIYSAISGSGVGGNDSWKSCTVQYNTLLSEFISVSLHWFLSPVSDFYFERFTLRYNTPTESWMVIFSPCHFDKVGISLDLAVNIFIKELYLYRIPSEKVYFCKSVLIFFTPFWFLCWVPHAVIWYSNWERNCYIFSISF